MLIVSSKVLLALVGLDRSVRWVGYLGRVSPPYRPVESVEQIPWSIDTVAARLPGEFDCLDRAVAGNALLAASGYRGRIRLGVDKRDDAFEAHAWIEWNDEVLIGDLDDLDRFRTLPESEVAPF